MMICMPFSLLYLTNTVLYCLRIVLVRSCLVRNLLPVGVDVVSLFSFFILPWHMARRK